MEYQYCYLEVYYNTVNIFLDMWGCETPMWLYNKQYTGLKDKSGFRWTTGCITTKITVNEYKFNINLLTN